MGKREIIKLIQNKYDKIYVSCSGGKDSVASMLFAVENFDRNKISVIWVDIGYDFPELFPYMVYLGYKSGLHLDVLKPPTPLEQLAKHFGNLSHRTRWCGPEGKFLTISHYFSIQPKDRKCVSFEGTRWAESRARQNRTFFSDESESFVQNATFRPILEFSDHEVCNYVMERGYSLNPTYRFFDRTGCYICPEHTIGSWGLLRAIYPNLYRRYLEFLKECKRNMNWVCHYAVHDLQRITKVIVTKETFEPPFTAGYVSIPAIEKITGIKNDRIRDDPDYTFEKAVEDADVSIDYNIIQTPQPDRHKEILAKLEEK